MCASRIALPILLTAAVLGCSSNPPTSSAGPGATAEVEAVPVPAELAGKWRLESREGRFARVMVYHIAADGRIEADVHVKTPNRENRDRLKSVVTRVEGDKLTVTDISRASEEGTEDVLSPERRQPRMVQFRVTGDELHWKRENEPEWVLTRVKE